MPEQQTVLTEIHLSGADAQADANGGDLLWAPILRECEYDKTPGPNGLVDKPFVVTRDGKSVISENGLTISMEELKANFEAGAFDGNVTIPLTDEEGTDHKKDVARFNTGFVKALKIEEGTDGAARLIAGLEFTEPDIKGKCERGTIRNRSAGIYLNPKGDGLALKHCALTNTPFMKDLEPFGALAASEDQSIEGVIGINLSDDGSLVDTSVAQPSTAENQIVWDTEQSVEWLRDQLSAHFRQLSEKAEKLGGNPVYYFVKDVAHSTERALVSNDVTGKTYVVPFEIADDGVAVSNPDAWIEAEQVMVAASDDSHPIDRIRAAIANGEVPVHTESVQLVLSDGSAATFSDGRLHVEAPAEEDDKPAPAKTTAVVEASAGPEVGSLSWASQQREQRFSRNENQEGGTAMPRGNLLEAFEGVELSADQRAALEQAEADQAEKDRLERESRKTTAETRADARVAELSEAGWKNAPGFLKAVRRYLVADDGQTAAVVELSDDNGQPAGERQVTITEVVNGLIDALPAIDSEQQAILLSDQVNNVPGAAVPPPAADAETPVDERVRAAREFLGKPDPTGGE